MKGEHSLADNAELGPHLADLGLTVARLMIDRIASLLEAARSRLGAPAGHAALAERSGATLRKPISALAFAARWEAKLVP